MPSRLPFAASRGRGLPALVPACALAAVLAACGGRSISADLPDTHPASPAAPQAPLPPVSQTLALPAGADPAAAPDGDTLYSCSMHPEVLEQDPGSCPICGMALARREGGF